MFQAAVVHPFLDKVSTECFIGGDSETNVPLCGVISGCVYIYSMNTPCVMSQCLYTKDTKFTLTEYIIYPRKDYIFVHPAGGDYKGSGVELRTTWDLLANTHLLPQAVLAPIRAHPPPAPRRCRWLCSASEGSRVQFPGECRVA